MTEERPSDRRKAARSKQPHTPGWILLSGESHPVQLFDVSNLGAGVKSARPFANDAVLTLRVGMGPLRFPRTARVTRCTPTQDGGYHLGVTFVADLAGRIEGIFGKVG